MPHRQPWSPRDEKFLRDAIEAHTIGFIAKRLGRTYDATYYRAVRIGAIRASKQGYESVTDAAARCGFSYPSMLRLLRWAGVDLQAGKQERERRKTKCVRHYVDPCDADAAVARWARSETILQASVRLDIGDSHLRKYLELIGAAPPDKVPGRRVRLDPDVFDRAYAAGKARAHAVRSAVARRAALARAAKQRATGMSLPDAAATCGVSADTLRRALRAVGHRMVSGKFPALDAATVAAAMAAHAARKRKTGLSVTAAAAKYGVGWRRLSAGLRAIGVAAVRGQHAMLTDAQVARALGLNQRRAA